MVGIVDTSVGFRVYNLLRHSETGRGRVQTVRQKHPRLTRFLGGVPCVKPYLLVSVLTCNHAPTDSDSDSCNELDLYRQADR